MQLDRYVIVLVIAFLIMSHTANQCAAEGTNTAAALAENGVNFSTNQARAMADSSDGYHIENGIAVLPILPGNDTAVQSLLASLAKDPDFNGISMLLYSPIGAKPKILLSTNMDEGYLRHAVRKLKTIMNRMGQPHRLVVSAYLRAITMENDDFTGLSVLANGAQVGGVDSLLTTTTKVWDNNGNLSSITKTNPSFTATLGDNNNNNRLLGIKGSLTRAISNGKVIVGSELTIPNGTTAELKNDDSTPVPLPAFSSGGSTFNIQVISSDIKITPTIVQFNAEKPEDSIVRLDISIQLSIPTNTVNVGDASASEYVTQTLTSTHYVKANNERFIGGLFGSDTWMKSKSGIPILMNIPVLKHLFTYNQVSLQHLASILFVSVRILPVDKEDGYDW